MTIMRNYVKTLSDRALAVLWNESEDWERDGSLPETATLRQHVKEALPFIDFDGTFATPIVTYMIQFMSEVWREVAVRMMDTVSMDALDDFWGADR